MDWKRQASVAVVNAYYSSIENSISKCVFFLQGCQKFPDRGKINSVENSFHLVIAIVSKTHFIILRFLLMMDNTVAVMLEVSYL